jgi:hypothetical protein
MNEPDIFAEKLREIEKLWTELRHIKPDAPEYEILFRKIRALALEYDALTKEHQKQEKSK